MWLAYSIGQHSFVGFSMKKVFRSYFSFTQKERYGVGVLIILLLLLQIILFCMTFWIKPDEMTNEEKNWRTAWSQRKKEFLFPDSAESELPIAAISLSPFDPNTLDSIGFSQLGLKPKTIHLLLNWRRKGKVFYKKEDLKPLYTLSEADYARMEPFIRINVQPEKNQYSNANFKRESEPAFLNLNTTDSSSLVKLNGIGPTLAHKIIARRQALGGFINHAQLLEIYRFPDSTFLQLQQKLHIDPLSIVKIKLNTCNLEQLKAHPYIGEKIGNNIILLRNGLGRFENIEQLRQVPLMNAEIYRKIAPYFIVE